MEWHLKLVVGEEGLEIDTVPQMMANASPVFRQMLQPNGFAEGQDISKTGSLVVLLPDDDASAMTILCDIFHLRSDRIPIKDVTSDTMADIATLVDKYDCAAAIQPWPKLWLNQLLDGKELELTERMSLEEVGKELEHTERMSLEEVGKWVHISCHLGLDKQFSQMTSALICRASLKDFCEGPLLFEYQKLSQIVQDSIKNARETAIESYYQSCFDLIEDLKDGNHCSLLKTNLYKDHITTFDCSSVALGNAFLAAKEVCDGDNWELIENWTGSIDHHHERMRIFASRLSGPNRIYQARNMYREPSHSSCSLSDQFLKAVDKIYESGTVGLRLELVGNHIYRSSVSSDEKSK